MHGLFITPIVGELTETNNHTEDPFCNAFVLSRHSRKGACMWKSSSSWIQRAWPPALASPEVACCRPGRFGLSKKLLSVPVSVQWEEMA